MRGLQVKNGLVNNIAVFDEIPNGWIDAPDGVGIGWIDNGDGTFSAPVVEPAPLAQEDYSSAAQSMLDQQAQSMGYDSIFTAVSYEDDAHQKFNDEAVALKAWRSMVWVAAYAALADFEAGDIAQPTIDEFIAGLPAFGG